MILSQIPSKTPVTDVKTGLMDRLWQRYFGWIQDTAVAATPVRGECLLTATGFAGAAPTATFEYQIYNEDFVILAKKNGSTSLNGTSNTINMDVFGVPPEIFPSVEAICPINLLNNGQNGPGFAYFDPTNPGVITFFNYTVAGAAITGSPFTFTAANLKGINDGSIFMYRLRRP